MFRRKYITFSVPIGKEVIRIDKSRKEKIKTIFYRLQFTGSARFTSISLSNLINNLAEGIHRIKCKYRQVNKKCETCRVTYKNYGCFSEYTDFKDYLKIKMFMLYQKLLTNV